MVPAEPRGLVLTRLPIVDLTRQARQLEPGLSAAVRRVLARGSYILGPEVAAFEKEFARFSGARFAAGVASGTDALQLALMALGVGPGDLVATVSFTFIATADAILHVGAQPLFVDIEPFTYTMDPADLESRIEKLPRRDRRRLKAVIPVHMYGHPCDMDAIRRVARRHRLAVIEDAAQSAGASWKGKPVGSLGDIGCFSFYPSKTLGACGDAGMVTTGSARLDARLRLLRVHGRPDRDTQVELGRNSRLDEIQAAILRIKLRRLRAWIAKRGAIAAEYTRHLSRLPGIRCPRTARGARHAFYTYAIRSPRRDRIRKELAAQGITAFVYYPIPVHRQPLHRKKYGSLRLPETDRACREVLSLPIFPEMKLEEAKRVCRIITRSVSSA